MKKIQSYNCDKCRDLTFILDGDIAVSCDCRSLRQAESILKLSGISEEFRKKTFDSFNYAYDIQTIDAYSKASGYYSSFLDIRCSRKNSIMFLGQVGSGKTHLSLAIANKLMDDGF
ncbi:MAG: ATP-binding protein, partial [Peptostreptococcaceae bacterium]|nr:ATP-binding protein [Peptostreptococcaceae bacterium]